MNKLIFVLLITIFWACQHKTEIDVRKSTASIEDSLSAELRTLHARGFINGFGVAIVNQNGTIYANGIGFSNTRTHTKYTRNTIQNIGSVSKTFIGLALLKAQELGKLDLDDAVMDYLPFEVKNPYYPDKPITIRHLATHTSTILDTDHYNEKSYILKENAEVSDSLESMSETFNSPDSRIPLLDFLERLLSREGQWYQETGFSNQPPGEIFEYSNVGATLAATVLEIATGEPFDEFVTEHIMEPLGMNSSGWSFDDVNLSEHSTLYASPKIELPYYSLITYPDGGLITSISDLGKYLSELINAYSGDGVLLSNESYQEVFREQLEAHNFLERDIEDDYDDEYNTGIFMGFTPSGLVGHTGGDPGIATYMFFNPLTKSGRILMINTSVRDSGGVEQFYSIWDTLGDYEIRLNSIWDTLGDYEIRLNKKAVNRR